MLQRIFGASREFCEVRVISDRILWSYTRFRQNEWGYSWYRQNFMALQCRATVSSDCILYSSSRFIQNFKGQQRVQTVFCGVTVGLKQNVVGLQSVLRFGVTDWHGQDFVLWVYSQFRQNFKGLQSVQTVFVELLLVQTEFMGLLLVQTATCRLWQNSGGLHRVLWGLQVVLTGSCVSLVCPNGLQCAPAIGF